jgi:hypothetical protein
MVQTFDQVVADRSWPVHNRGYACPACGSWHIVSVVVGDARRRFCTTCESCWDVHGDHARRVEPLRCAGCGHEAQCYERLRRVLPLFTWDDGTVRL